MTPSVDARLASMITAISKTIIPAIPDDESLAREQASLLLGHLHMLRGQIDHSVRYEAFALMGIKRLAQLLVEQADGVGARASAAIERLRGALAGIPATPSPSDVRDATTALGAAIEDLIDRGLDDASPAFSAYAAGQVIMHDREWAMNDRAWFAGAGFDPARETLPDIADLMDTLAHQFERACS